MRNLIIQGGSRQTERWLSDSGMVALTHRTSGSEEPEYSLCSAPPDSDSFEDLSDELMEKYSQRFCYPEMFLEVDGKIVCLPVVT